METIFYMLDYPDFFSSFYLNSQIALYAQNKLNTPMAGLNFHHHCIKQQSKNENNRRKTKQCNRDRAGTAVNFNSSYPCVTASCGLD